MQFVKPSSAVEVKRNDVSELGTKDWFTMYTATPQGHRSLFELEGLVAKRMELLAWIEQLVSSPSAESFEAILKEIGSRLPDEARSHVVGISNGPVLGSEDSRRSTFDSKQTTSFRGGTSSLHISFEKDEDLISHLLCRFAFCMSDRWRKWYVKNEEILLRARVRLEMEKDNTKLLLVNLMKKNNLPCETLDAETLSDPTFLDYLDYRSKRNPGSQHEKPEHFYAVSMSLATRLIKNRNVLLRKGKAILYRDQVQEVFLTVFRGTLNRGLHNAYLERLKQQNLHEEDEKQNVLNMLDAFLEHFVADPSDNLAEGQEGSVRAGDVSHLAKTHFPLCMRQIDSHLRREGHLRHHGRFTYGLFLKAIGLSLEDSLQLFSTLMTVKGGGSLESFSKSAYGYNVRHNYGTEGKKTSYTSASCTTILGLPPTVDHNDCHGCPFRFRDEGKLRSVLQFSQNDPRGKGFGEVSLSAADIEDVISDCKGQHYTRACYKYFMATHRTAKRDTLFRSPYEYYAASREVEVTDEPNGAAERKRPSGALLKEDSFRTKSEQTGAVR